MQAIRRILVADENGFTLIEMMGVVLIIGVLAAITAVTVPDLLSASKSAALKSTLGALQAASDRFRLVAGKAPTGSVQPDAATNTARLIDFSAADGDGKAFYPAYVTAKVSEKPGDYGISTSDQKLCFYVTASGKVFAASGAAACSASVTVGGTTTTTVYIQEDVTGNARSSAIQ